MVKSKKTECSSSSHTPSHSSLRGSRCLVRDCVQLCLLLRFRPSPLHLYNPLLPLHPTSNRLSLLLLLSRLPCVQTWCSPPSDGFSTLQMAQSFPQTGEAKGGGWEGIYFGGGGVIKRPNSPSHLFVSDDFPGVDHQLSYNTVKDSTFVRVSNFLKSKTGSKYNLQCRRVELQVLSPPVHLSAVRKSHITPNHPLASFDLYAHEITMGIPNQKVGFGQVSHSRMKKRNQDR